MSQGRILISDRIDVNREIRLSKEDSNYIKRVLRLSRGDVVRIFNDKDGEFSATIAESNKKGVTVVVDERLKDPEGLQKRFGIIIGRIANHRLGWALQKCTELGVDDFVVFSAQYSRPGKISMSHLKEIARSATEQSGRFCMPRLSFFDSLKSAITSISHRYVNRVFLDPYGNIDLKSFLEKKCNNIVAVIGCEGGFCDDEIRMLEYHDFVGVCLKGWTLRSETAAVAASSLISQI